CSGFLFYAFAVHTCRALMLLEFSREKRTEGVGHGPSLRLRNFTIENDLNWLGAGHLHICAIPAHPVYIHVSAQPIPARSTPSCRKSPAFAACQWQKPRQAAINI